MQVFNRLMQPKRFALSLWIAYLALLTLALSTWHFSPRKTQLKSAPEDDGPALINVKRIDVATAEMTAMGARLAKTSAFRQSQPLFPRLPVRKSEYQTLPIADALIVQSGNRLVVFLNGHPVTKGTRLPSGEVVTKLTQQAITLVDPTGSRRNIALGSRLSVAPAISKDESK